MDGRSELNDALLEAVSQREVKEVVPGAVVNAPGWDELGHGVMEAVRHVAPEQYQAELESQLDTHSHLKNVTENQQIGLGQTLLEELAKVGLSSSAVSEQTGVLDLDPWHMPGRDLTRVLEWSQQNRPDVLVNLTLRWQDQPNVVASILGDTGLATVQDKLGPEKAQALVAK